MSEGINFPKKLRERVVKRKQYCKDRLIDSISKHGIQVDANEYQLELVMLNEFLRWIDELSTSDEQTQPGLLPCPFCGDEAIEVVCPWNSEEIAFTCPSTNCLVFGRQGIGDRRLTYGPRWAARNWWNTRANKTQ